MIECTSLQGEAWSLLTCTYVFKVQGQTRHKSEQDDELRTICSSTYIGRLEVEKRKALCGVDVSASVESRIPLLHVQLRWRCCCLPAEHTEFVPTASPRTENYFVCWRWPAACREKSCLMSAMQRATAATHHSDSESYSSAYASLQREHGRGERSVGRA
jgi:hypothetical protein